MSRAPLVFAAGVLAGAGLVVAVMKTAQTSPLEPDEALLRRLDAIEMDLRFFATTLAERTVPEFGEPRAEAMPSPLADARLDDVLARLDALQADVRKLAEPAGAPAAPVELEAAAPVVRRTVEPLPEALPDAPLNLAAFAPLTGRSMDELGLQHQLWTYAKVGESYGRPTRVAPSPGGVGIKYYYELPDGREFIFWFTDGKVIGAFWGDE